MSRQTSSRSSFVILLGIGTLLVSLGASAQDQALPPATPAPSAKAPSQVQPAQPPAKAQPPKAQPPKGQPPKAPPPETAPREGDDEAARSAAGDTPTGSPSYVETVPAEPPSEAATSTPPPARPRHRTRPPAEVYPAAPPPEYGGPAWPSAPPPPPRTERRSTGMMVAGIVLTSVGALGLVAGGVLISQARQQNDVVCVNGPCASDSVDEGKRNVGIGVAVVGLASLGVGIPLLVVGARKVPVEQPAAAALPRLELGPTGGRLTWSF